MSANEIENIYNKRNKFYDLFLFVFFTLLSLLLYYPCINNFFVLDDLTRLVVIIKGSLGGEAFHYTPVPLVIYRISYLVFGIDPVPIRILHILINGVFCFYVFKVSYRLFYRFGNDGAAGGVLIKSFLVSCLFSISYFHVESIAYFNSLHELLYSLFFIQGIYYYMVFRDTGKKYSLVPVLLFYFLSLFSKETAISFVICIFTAELLVYKQTFKQSLTTTLPFIIITLIFIAARYFIYPNVDEIKGSFNLKLIVSESVKNFIFVFTAFIASLDFMALKEIYRLNNSDLITSVREIVKQYPGAIAAIFLSALFYVAVLRKPNKIIYISFGFIIITILSFIWLIAYERYLYLPSAGFCILVIHFAYKQLDKGRVIKYISIILLMIFFVYNIIHLVNKRKNWEIAAEISKNTITEIILQTKELPAEAIVGFKDLPDNYMGAWILRGGIHAVPELFMNRKDLKFYNDYQMPPDMPDKNKIYIYDYNNRSLKKL